MKTEKAAGDIIIGLQKISEYHAGQVKMWKGMLENGPNVYAQRMLAMHLEFGGALLLASHELAKSKTLEGTAT